MQFFKPLTPMSEEQAQWAFDNPFTDYMRLRMEADSLKVTGMPQLTPEGMKEIYDQPRIRHLCRWCHVFGHSDPATSEKQDLRVARYDLACAKAEDDKRREKEKESILQELDEEKKKESRYRKKRYGY